MGVALRRHETGRDSDGRCEAGVGAEVVETEVRVVSAAGIVSTADCSNKKQILRAVSRTVRTKRAGCQFEVHERCSDTRRTRVRKSLRQTRPTRCGVRPLSGCRRGHRDEPRPPCCVVLGVCHARTQRFSASVVVSIGTPVRHHHAPIYCPERVVAEPSALRNLCSMCHLHWGRRLHRRVRAAV